MGQSVSYIMASKNAALYMRAAVESVLKQTHADLELIVVDDSSDDTSRAIAESYASQDSRVKVFSNEGSGVSAARNRALAAASGAWIAILDADDLIHPQRTEKLLAIAEDRQADIVADNLIRFFSARPDIAPALLIDDAAWRAQRRVSLHEYQAAALDSTSLPALGVLKPLIRRSARLTPQLRYREDLRIGEDQDLYARLMNAGAQFEYTPDAYYLYRKHVQSTSHRLARADIEAMEAAERDFLTTIEPADHEARSLSIARIKQLKARARAASALEALRGKNVPGALGALGADMQAYAKVAQSLGEAMAKRLKLGATAQAPTGAKPSTLERAYGVFRGERPSAENAAEADLAAMLTLAFADASGAPERAKEQNHV